MVAAVMATLPAVGPASDPSSTLLAGRRIAFTTPSTYGGRLSGVLSLAGAAPLPIPAVAVGPSPATVAAIRPFLSPAGALDPFSALAFTSRSGILALSLVAGDGVDSPSPLSDSGDLFTVAALGSDADLLRETDFLSRLCRNARRIRVLVPATASPAGLAEALGPGRERRVLCPVPAVIGLEEPPVIPDFVRSLEEKGWVPVRVPAYETRWAGPGCAEGLRAIDGELDAIVFTSTAEVEGLMKGLAAARWDWKNVRRRWPEMVVGAHGPVTAKGAERFGIIVDVVSSRFGSFDGIVEALASKLGPCSARR